MRDRWSSANNNIKSMHRKHTLPLLTMLVIYGTINSENTFRNSIKYAPLKYEDCKQRLTFWWLACRYALGLVLNNHEQICGSKNNFTVWSGGWHLSVRSYSSARTPNLTFGHVVHPGRWKARQIFNHFNADEKPNRISGASPLRINDVPLKMRNKTFLIMLRTIFFSQFLTRLFMSYDQWPLAASILRFNLSRIIWIAAAKTSHLLSDFEMSRKKGSSN